MKCVPIALALALIACGPAADDETGGAAGSDPGTVCDAGQLLLDGDVCLDAGMQPDGCPAGSRWVEARSQCVEAGIDDDGCPAGTLTATDGSCEPAGILPGSCAAGFSSDDGGGCTPLLPAAPCASGEMAVPGDSSCRPVASCGAPPWGGIPVAANTVYVDASATGQKDGSSANPYDNIQQAVNAAPAGAVVAVAPGSYPEDVVISGKGVQLWGSCPATTEILGSAIALAIAAGADGSRVAQLALSGAGVGLEVRGASQVSVEHVWVHDTAGRGIAVVDGAPESSIVLSGSLVERSSQIGVWISGASASIDGLAVRDTQPVPSQGFGLVVEEDETTFKRADATVTRSLLERNAEGGVMLHAADLVIDATVVRDTQPNQLGRFGRGIQIQTAPPQSAGADALVRDVVVDGAFDGGIVVAASHARIERTVVRNVSVNQDVGDKGIGIGVQHDPGSGSAGSVEIERSLVEHASDNGILAGASQLSARGVIVRDTQPVAGGDFGRGIALQLGLGNYQPGSATLEGCVLEGNRDISLFLQGSDALVERVLVTDTLPRADGLFGYGLAAYNGPLAGQRGTVEVRASRFEGGHEIGLYAAGSDLVMASSVVADTAAQQASGTLGRGLNVQDDATTGNAGSAVIRSSLVSGNLEIGIMIGGASASLEGVRIEHTRATDAAIYGGRALNVQVDPMSLVPATVDVRFSHFVDSQDAGMFVSDSMVTFQGSVIEGTAATSRGEFGDGIVVISFGPPTALGLEGSRVSDSARAGITVFGAAMTLGDSRMSCNAIDIDAEPHVAGAAELSDAGGNRCGCSSREECQAVSTALAAPQPFTVE